MTTSTQPLTFRRALSTIGAAIAAIACIAAVFISGAGTALAPSPARLDGALEYNGSWNDAVYVDTHIKTIAIQLPKDWTSSWARAYPGYPCSPTRAAAGTTLYGYVVSSGSYARCAGL